MKNASIALALIVFAILATGCFDKQAPDGFAAISILPKRGDFGIVQQGEPATYYLSIENLGPGNIMLLGIEGGCPCPSVKFDRNFLRPGDVIKAELTFDTSNYPGRLEQQLAISTDNVETPLFHFQITGMVKPGFIIQPEQFRISKEELKNGKMSFVSSLQNLSDKQVIVKSISTTAEHMNARLDGKGKMPKKLPPGKSIDLRIVVMPVDEDANLNAKVIVETKGAAKNRYEIAVIEK